MDIEPYVKRPWTLYIFATLGISLFLILGCVGAASLRWIQPEVAGMTGLILGCVCIGTVIGFLSAAGYARVTERLLELGFQKTAKAKNIWRSQRQVDPEAEAVFRRHSGVKSSGYIVFAAFREEDDGQTWVLRHIIPRGKYSEFRAALVRTQSRAWPEVKIRRRGMFASVSKLFGTKPVEIDPEFDKKYHVRSDTPEFAVLLVGPEMQAACTRLKSAEQLTVGSDGVSVISRAMTLPRTLLRLLETLETAHAAIAPELNAWHSGLDDHAIPNEGHN